jgi:hypothetical protein
MSEQATGPIVIEKEVDLDAIIARRKGGQPAEVAAGKSDAGSDDLDSGAGNDDDGGDDIGAGGPSNESSDDSKSSGSHAEDRDGSSGSPDSAADQDKDLDDEDIVDLSKKKEESDEPAKEDGKQDAAKPLDFIEIDGHKLTADETISELRRLSSIEQAILEDEWLTAFIKNYAAGTDPLKYIEATRIDYTKVSDLDLLKEEFAASLDVEDRSVVDRAWKKHLKKQFGYDTDSGKYTGEDDDDAALNEATLRREANKIRKKRVEDQKQYITKAKDVRGSDAPKGPDTEARKKALESHPQAKDFSGSGMLVVDVGEAGKFAIKAPEAKDIISSASDTSKIFAKFGLGPSGEVTEKTDLSKLFKALLLADNPAQYERKLIAIGRTLQKRETFKTARTIDPAAAAAGRVAGGDPVKNEKREILKAFRDHGKHVTIGG